MIHFRLFGIPVRVHPFFWITLAVLGGALHADSADDILNVALFLLAGFVSILVHEMGHALTAKKFGAAPMIELQAFGGYAAFSGVRMTRTKSFLISAAGPFFQIVLGLGVFFVFTSLRLESFKLNPEAVYFLHVLVLISLIWALFNLLPVLPLDGGQILNSMLGPQRVRLTLWISLTVAIASGLAMFIYFGNIFGPIVMGIFAWQSWQTMQQIRSR